MRAMLPTLRLAVVVFWLGLLAFLYTGPDAPGGGVVTNDPPSAAAPAPREETWMGVYIGERKIGYSHHRFVPEANGYRFEEQSLLRMRVLDTEQTIRVLAQGTTGSDYALRAFVVSLASGVGTFEAEGVVENDAIELTMRSGGEQTRQRLRLDKPLYVPVGAREQFARSGLSVGRQLTFDVFDPSSMQNHPLQLSVVAREPIPDASGTKDAWRVRETFRGIETTVWFDEAGRVVREQGPMGLTTVRESAQQALAVGVSDDGAFDLMGAVAIPVEHPIANPRTLRRLEVRLKGITDAAVPVDARQQRHGDIVQIEREDAPATETFVLPYRGAEWQRELEATPFLQVDHPRIRAAAAEALGSESDAARAAERLRRWVFEHVRKVPTASIPNALQVLTMGAGDCNEHAVLFAALARAVGLPSRVVAGTVYADGVFLYHAWNEVWLGSSWVSADAAFDQMPVDATHIKLIEGGPEQHVAIVPLIGRLSIDVIGAS